MKEFSIYVGSDYHPTKEAVINLMHFELSMGSKRK